MFFKRIDMDDQINTSPQVVTLEQRQKYLEIRNKLLTNIINLIDPKTAKKTIVPNIECILENANLIKNINLIRNGLSKETENHKNKFIKIILSKVAEYKKRGEAKESINKIINYISIVGTEIEKLAKTIQETDQLMADENMTQAEVFNKLQDEARNTMVAINGYIDRLIKKGILKESQNLKNIEAVLNRFFGNNDSYVTEHKERSKEDKATAWK